MALAKNLTARIYQAGLERADAIKQGADPAMFDQLVSYYKDGSIPVPDLYGYTPKKKAR